MAVNDPSPTIDKLPTTSADAQRVFDERYLMALDAKMPRMWSDEFGEFIPDAPSMMTTFPISMLGGSYKRSRGGNRFKKMAETSFDVKVEEFDTGHEARAIDLFTQTFAYRKWLAAPARFLVREARHRNRAIAALLEDGENVTIWDKKKFFAEDHPANPSDPSAGTCSNLQTTPVDIAGGDTIGILEAEVTAMRDVRDEEGEKMETSPNTLWLPTAKFERVKNKLKKDLIAEDTENGTAAVNNPYVGTFNLIHVPTFEDANDFYIGDTTIADDDLPPWISMRYVPPAELGLRHWDMSNSDESREKGTLKVSSHIWYGFALAFWHAIRKVKGA